jgi:hypothetical protein
LRQFATNRSSLTNCHCENFVTSIPSERSFSSASLPLRTAPYPRHPSRLGPPPIRRDQSLEVAELLFEEMIKGRCKSVDQALSSVVHQLVGLVIAGRSCVVSAPDIVYIGPLKQRPLRPRQSRKQLRRRLEQRSAFGGAAAPSRPCSFLSPAANISTAAINADRYGHPPQKDSVLRPISSQP